MAANNGTSAAATGAAGGDLTGAASDLYANAFAASEPRSIHSLLTNRLKRAEQFNEDLAEYFRQRNLIEDTYVKGLLRLAKRPISTIGSGSAPLPGEELGDVASRVQQLLEKELTEVATSHTVFQRRMLQEVEAPLKEAASKGAWRDAKTYDTNLLSTIKDLEEGEARHAKSKAKLDATSASSKKYGQLQQKVGEDSRHLSIVRETYLTESPFALRHFQTVDQERLAFLNEAVARFETIQSDHAREVMELAEKGMMQILASDPREEMQDFAVKYGNAEAAMGLTGAPGRRGRGSSRTNGATSFRREPADSELMPPPPVPSINTPSAPAPPQIQRQASVRSTSRQSQSDTPSVRSGGGGLKSRFGGLLNRGNRHSQMPNLPDSPIAGSGIGATPDTSINDDGLAEQSFTTIQAPSTTGDDEVGGGERLGPSLTPTQAAGGAGSVNNRRSSFLPGMLARRKTSKSAPSQPPRELRTGGSPIAELPPLPEPSLAGSPGTAMASMPGPDRPTGYEMSQRDALDAINEDRARDLPLPFFPNSASAGGALPPGAAPPVAPAAATALPAKDSSQVDADGFTVPPANRDRAPWETAGAATAGTSLLDDDDGSAPLSASGAPPVAQFAIQPVSQPKTTSAEQDAAMQRVKSTLLSSGNVPSRRSTAARGRRDRVSAFIPDDMPLSEVAKRRQTSLPFSTPAEPSPRSASPSTAAFTASPPQSPFSSQVLPPQSQSPSRTGSLLSTSSSQANLATQAANPFAGAAASASFPGGIRASITETVNVLIKGGVVQRTMVTGEIAFLLKDVPASGGPTLRFRVSGADRFEKVAANSALIDGTAGEYTIRPALLSSTQGTSHVVLKYQLRVSEANGKAYIPLEVTPQWRNEPMQTSMMLTYNVNPSCVLLSTASPSLSSPFDEPGESASLEQVSFAAQVSSSVANVQSRPEGDWNAADKKMTWKLDNGVQGQGKILARFAHDTEGLNVPIPVVVRWLVKGKNVSGVGLEMVGGDEETMLKIEEVAKTTVSGKYLAA